MLEQPKKANGQELKANDCQAGWTKKATNQKTMDYEPLTNAVSLRKNNRDYSLAWRRVRTI